MRERQEIEQVLSLEDRNEIINALLRTAEAHPMIDLRATAYGMCRAVAAVRRYDDRLTATDGATATEAKNVRRNQTAALSVKTSLQT